MQLTKTRLGALAAAVVMTGAGAAYYLNSGCPEPFAESWDHYNHPENYVVRPGAITAIEPCYVTVQFDTDSIRFLSGEMTQGLALAVGMPVEVEYRLADPNASPTPIPNVLGYLKFDASPTPTPSPTETPTPSPSPSPSPTGTPSPSPSPTVTPTPTPTATPTPSSTPTPTPSPSPSPSPSVLPTCKPNQVIGQPPVCRCLTMPIGNPKRCKP